jgi:hypothetical protein
MTAEREALEAIANHGLDARQCMEIARAALAAPPEQPVAWQERQMTSNGWTSWYDAGAPTSMGKGPGLSEVLAGIEYQWRPLYATPPAPTEQPAVLQRACDLLSMTIGTLMGQRFKIGYTDNSPIAALVAEAVEFLRPWPEKLPTEQPRGAEDARLPAKEWAAMEYWLDRCYDKGHLERCSDLVEPYEALCKAIAARAAQDKGGSNGC